MITRKPDTKRLSERLDSYFFTYLKENTAVVADTESLAAYLGMTRDELNALEGDRKYGRAVKIAKTRIAAIKKQLAYKGQIPVTLLTFDLRNDHGYRDKPEDTQSGIVILRGNIKEWGN